MTQFTIQDQLEAQYVKRWIIVHTTKEQSVAEHSFNVALIAREICRVLAPSDCIRHEVIEYALDHDLYEVFSGDIPKNFKNGFEEQTGMKFPDPVEKPSPQAVSIVKMADIIETTSFINRHGLQTKRGLQVADMMMDNLHRELTKAAFDSHYLKAAREVYRQIYYGERSWKC